MTTTATLTAPQPVSADARQTASDLRDFLLTTCASKLHPDAGVMASWLTILLTSCTPDATELLEAEVKSILFIMEG